MIEVFIEKPLYGNMCFVRDTYINKAKASGEKLHVKSPKGELTCTADEWLKGAKLMEKVFLRPNQPMRLFGKNVPMYEDKNQLRMI